MASRLAESLRAWYDVPARINKLAAWAVSDLYYGPYTAGACDDDDNPDGIYPGFSEAVNEIKAWWYANAITLFHDDSGFLTTTIPKEVEVIDEDHPLYGDIMDVRDFYKSDLTEDQVRVIDYYDLYYILDTSEQASLLFGKELAKYL